MTYRCRYFSLHELLPPDVYYARGEMGWQLLDERLLRAIDALRDRYGPMIVNNWRWGGNRQWSGLRTPDSPYYSPYSQHTFGRAADCLFSETTAQEVRREILDYPDDDAHKLIQSVELDVSWLHIDVRNCDRIMTYTPTAKKLGADND